jgi:hypothetical protein
MIVIGEIRMQVRNYLISVGYSLCHVEAIWDMFRNESGGLYVIVEYVESSFAVFLMRDNEIVAIHSSGYFTNLESFQNLMKDYI